MGTKRLIFWYLVLFPFGQLPKLILQFLGLSSQFQIVDLLVLIIFLSSWPIKFSKNAKFLILVFSFSWAFSLATFGIKVLNPGLLYLIRFITYLGLFYATLSLVNKKTIQKLLLLKAFIGVCIAIAVFGWVQLLLVPDLRALIQLGWDDHYYRLVSTFLDPAFTGIILLIGSWVSFKYYQFAKNRNYMAITLFLALTIIPTYSRATYLAAITLIVFNFLNDKIGKVHVLAVTLVFILIILIIPKPVGEGGNLLRTRSIDLKLQNANVAAQIFKSSPVFGVGFNNICATKKNLKIENGGQNACSGLDNSLSFILASTGIAGFFVFTGFVMQIIKNTSKNYLGQIFLGTLLVIFIHGQFTNTFFYPWIMGALAILGGISRIKGNN